MQCIEEFLMEVPSVEYVQGNLQATRMQKGVLLKNPESERPVCTFGSLDSHA